MYLDGCILTLLPVPCQPQATSSSERASASTNDSVLSGARSAKHLFSSLPLVLLTQLPWAGELSPQHMGLELFKAKLEPPENLRGIPESHWENLTRAIQEGISTTGLSLCSVQGKNHIFLCSLLIRTCQICCWAPLQSGHSLAQLEITFCQKHWCQRMVSLKRTPCRVRSSSLQNSRRKCGYFQSFHD